MSATDVQALLRAHAPHASEPLRARVLALEPAPRRMLRPRALVAVAAAVALAVAAAVVHGVLGGSGGGTVRVEQHGAVASAPARVPLAPATGAGATPTSAPATAAPAPNVTGSARLKKVDASLQVRVPDVQQLARATTAATRIATSLGGYAQSVVYRTPSGGGGASYIELRVPVQNVQTALARLGALGTVVAQQVSTQDLQHLFEVESAQISQLRRTVAALERALADPALPDAQKVLLRIKLAETKRALAQRLHARTGTVGAGTTARISLVLGTQKAIVPVAHHRGRLGRMLDSAVGFLGLEAMIALYALIVVSPLVLLAALAWLLRRAWRRREEQRLLAA